VDGVSLSVDRGEIVGLIGANGSGKTTTMRMLLGLIRPTAGSARIAGGDVARAAVRDGVGYLPDDPPLDERWTVGEQLDWWESVRGPARRRADIEGVLGVESNKRISELSRGNRQKVAITLTLMHDPQLIVMDEPATGLDPLVRRELWAALRAAADRGAAVFVSSHVLGDIEHVCDRVVVLREGRAVFDGPVDELARSSRRIVSIEFGHAAPRAAFAGLPGVVGVLADNSRLDIEVVGPIDVLVKAAADFEVVDFSTSQATLESGFVTLNEEVDR
jgi:ABC-2 type transport system ATP-binding protein